MEEGPKLTYRHLLLSHDGLPGALELTSANCIRRLQWVEEWKAEADAEQGDNGADEGGSDDEGGSSEDERPKKRKKKASEAPAKAPGRYSGTWVQTDGQPSVALPA